MQNLANYLTNYVNSNVMPIVVTVVFLVIVLIGFAFMGGREGRDWGKKQLLFTLFGTALVYGGATIAQEVAAAFGF